MCIMGETSETLKLAEAERAKQEIHELEFSFGGERDLQTHFEKCPKHPGHHKFVPVKQFNALRLPKDLATDKIISWIKCTSQLTVKVSVKYVSPNRPTGYLLWNRRGQRVMSVGSGHVTEYPREGDNYKMPCPFTKCAGLSECHEVYGYITIATAAHVVFDDEEAKTTTVEFFYDHPDDKRGVVTAREVKVRTSSREGDLCEFLCVTHDIFLISHLRLSFLMATRSTRKDYMLDKSITWPLCKSHNIAKLSVNYVSLNRPPGYPLSDRAGQKVVSVGSGRVIDVSLKGNTDILTCPFTNWADLRRYELHSSITIVTAAHVVFDDEEAKNTTVEFFYDELDDRRHIVKARGVKVRNFSREEDLCELLCVTYDIILIRQLMYNLLTAKNGRKNYIFEKILPWPICTLHHTAKLSVNYVSPNRPSGYKLSDRRGQRVVSVGIGCVIDVSHEGNTDILTCPFTNCAYLPGYHEVCGYITIATAAHVVFDDEEAKNTTVEFFFDDMRHIVTARGVQVRNSSIEGDVCQLLCVTRDIFFIRHFTYNLLTVQVTGRTDDCLGKILTLPKCTSPHTAKLSVNYVSPNRPPGYPLYDRAGQRVVSVGSGRVIDVSIEGYTDKLTCLFSNCADLSKYEFRVNITIVTAVHVVFDDEEAKNTTVEFFYNDPDDRRHVVTARGVKVRTSSRVKDLCELLCVTDDELLVKWKTVYLQRSLAQKKRFCDFFRTILPGLESFQYERETGLKFIVNIRLSNPSEAVEALTVLMALTEEMITSVLKHWDFSKNSLKDVLESSKCDIWYMQTLLCFELDTAKLIDDGRKTTPFLHLNKTLTNLLGILTNSPQMYQNMFSSLIIELAKYYSTVEIVKKRLNACSSFMTEIFPRNVLKVVEISNDIATVEVTFTRDAHFTTLHHQYMIMDYYEHKPEFPHFRVNRCHFRGVSRPLELPSYYARELCNRIRKLCNRKCQREDNICKPGYIKCMSEESKCNKDDLIIVHIGHPHGQSKHITIGRQTDCLTGDGFYHQLYTAPTCPGCSGGPVWMIPASGDLSDVYGVPHYGHHGNELNSGCSWTLYPQEIDF